MYKETLQEDNKEILILFIIAIILGIILSVLILFILYYPDISNKYLNSQSIEESSMIASTEPYNSTQVKKSLYNILPGYTYFEDKGAMILFADIIPMDNDRLMVTAVQYHEANYVDELMQDATIKEIFYRLESGEYINKDNTIHLSILDNIAIFKDDRISVSMPYNGSLILIP